MPTHALSHVFDTLPDGRNVDAVTLQAGPLSATIIAYGATLQSLNSPDRDGRMADIVLGHDRIAPYVNQPTYLGATVGRYANRIAGARFTLDGRQHHLSANEGVNSLHGGVDGFDKRLWTIEDHGSDDASAFVILSLISPDGDQGYPGTLRVSVTYRLQADALTITFSATTDAPTAVNLTNHALFNMAGVTSGRSALDAELSVAATAYTPIDANLLPTGECRDVAGSVFDFRKSRRLSDGIRDASDDQIRIGRGYDHNFALREGRTITPKFAARLYDPLTGRGLDILTTEPGLQVYSGNFLDGTLTGKGNVIYRQGDGIALETQTFPDAPNQPAFPSAILRPGELYRQTTLFRLFSN